MIEVIRAEAIKSPEGHDVLRVIYRLPEDGLRRTTFFPCDSIEMSDLLARMLDDSLLTINGLKDIIETYEAIKKARLVAEENSFHDSLKLNVLSLEKSLATLKAEWLN